MNISKKIASSEFLTNTATLIGGTTIAQVLPLLFAPLISRLFGTDDFSVYGVFVSIYSILGTVITLRYDLAVMLPREEEKAKHVVALCLSSAFILTIFFFGLTLIFRNPISQLFNLGSNAGWLLLVPVAAFFLGTNNVLITWYNRQKQYKTIAANRIGRNTLLTGSNIGFGFAGLTSTGLIFSQLISDGIAALYYLAVFFKRALHGNIHFKRSEIRAVAKEYKDFPKFTLPATFVDSFSAQLPILLIAALYSQTLSGSYFFAYRILALPIAIIGAAFAQTFYQKFVSHIQLSDYKAALAFIRRSWLLLASIITLPAIIIFLWGEPLFIFIFGSEWAESGKISTILIFYILFAFISSPTSSTYIALGMQKYNLIFSICVLTYRFSTLYLGYVFHDFYMGLVFLICFEILEIIIYNFVVVRRLQNLENQNIKEQTP